MLEGDPWTAFLFLFHNHDWEPPLLARALETESFWVGAMGSPRTQKARRAALKAYGIEEEIIARVRGPIGLIPPTRDPATLGLSAFAEIAGAYRAVTNCSCLRWRKFVATVFSIFLCINRRCCRPGPPPMEVSQK